MKHPKCARIRNRLKKACALLNPCRLCPRACKVNRLKDQTGFCSTGFMPLVSSSNLHHGEEPPISGKHGSGTIFLTGCTMKCVYCQNYPISQMGYGNRVNLPQFAGKMLALQKQGAHNINFVTPTHFTAQILGALYIAFNKGLNIPIVYNCSGYESLDTLKLLDGIVDIYLPDMKYHAPDAAKRLSHTPDYPTINKIAILEMFRQVGHLTLDEHGIATRGLLIRHLVLPENLSGTDKILTWVAENLGTETHISLMNQYFPAHQASKHPPMHRHLNTDEYEQAKNMLENTGLENGWVQG